MNISERVRRQQKSLVGVPLQITNYIIDHPYEVALQSIHTLSRKLDISVASIVRVSKQLGYSGFAELKSDLAKEVQKNFIPMDQFQAISEFLPSEGKYLNAIAENEIFNINQTMKIIDKKEFDKAIELMTAANRICTMGLEFSQILAQMAAYLFNRVSLKAFALRREHGSLLEQILSISAKDVIIAISLPPYSKETIEAAEFALHKNIPTIAITNRLTAPIAPFCKVVLAVKTESLIFANSSSAILWLFYSLSAIYGFRNKQNMNNSFKQIKELRKKRKFEFVENL